MVGKLTKKRLKYLRGRVKSNLNGSQGIVSNVFSRMASIRRKPEGHEEILNLATINQEASRGIKAFNLVAKIDGREDRLFDAINGERTLGVTFH